MVFSGMNVLQGGGNGQFSFLGDVFQTGVGFPPNNRGLFAGPPESFKLLAQDSAAAPGLGGPQYDLNVIFVQSQGAGGATGFKAALKGTGVDATNDRAVFLGTSSGTVNLARTGSAAPGTAVTFSDLELPQVNQSNRAIFRATVAGAGVTTGVNDTGIWSGTMAGSSSLVVRGGITAPNFPALQLVDVTVPVQGNTAYAYRGTLSGPGIFGDNDNVIYHGTPGNWSTLVREGDNAPGFPATSTFFNTGSDMQMTRSNTVWFTSAVNGPGVNSFNNQGLWYGTPGNIQMVYREGTQAPGMPAGVFFRLNPLFNINNNNQFVMVTPVSDTGGVNVAGLAYFTGTATNLALVAYHGLQAPGLAAGVTFDMATFGFQPVISESGAVALYSFLSGPGVDAGVNDTGIWAYGAGQLKLVVRAGDAVDVDPGPGTDMRVISSLFFASQSFADDGRLMWGAYFNDGTQAIFYTTVAVPEPAALVVVGVALGLGGWWLYRRRREKVWEEEVFSAES